MNTIPSLALLIDRLSAAYGFTIPQALGEIVLCAIRWEERTSDPECTRPHYTDGIGFSLEIFDDAIFGTAEPLSYVPSSRYEIEPPEFFPFGRPGVDGISYGYLVRAPELDAPELPVYEMEPMTAAIVLQGKSTAAAIGYLFSLFGTDSDIEEPRGQASLELAAWSAAKVGPVQGTPLPSAPEFPGYRFEPSGDGVGVFAPAGAFAEYSAHFLPHAERNSPAAEDSIADSLAEVQSHLNAGYPASALLALRKTYRSAKAGYYVDEDNLIDCVFPLWHRCYVDLGRPLLAESVARMAIGQREALLSYRRSTSYRHSFSSTTNTDGTVLADPPVIEFILARRAEPFDREMVTDLASDVSNMTTRGILARFGERHPDRIEIVYEIQNSVVAAASASIDGGIATIDLFIVSEPAQPTDIQSLFQCLERIAGKRSITRIRIDKAAETVIANLAGDEWLDREITPN